MPTHVTIHLSIVDTRPYHNFAPFIRLFAGRLSEMGTNTSYIEGATLGLPYPIPPIASELMPLYIPHLAFGSHASGTFGLF